MIHRALLGSIERFIAVLIEHFAGAFPLWLAPVQARVLSVSEKAEAYARGGRRPRLQAEGLRVEADLAADKLGAKIRTGPAGQDPLHGGGRAKRTWRRAWFRHAPGKGKQLPAMPVDDFARRLAPRRRKCPVPGRHLPEGRRAALQWRDPLLRLTNTPTRRKNIPRPYNQAPPSATDNYRVGRRIRVPEVRVIGADGSQIGIIPTHEALKLAEEQGWSWSR